MPLVQRGGGRVEFADGVADAVQRVAGGDGGSRDGVYVAAVFFDFPEAVLEDLRI
ncbi:MAG: hypothetical protein WCK89_16135 [bacterium]